MYIIKEKDERKIDKVSELVGERSEKLKDAIKTIQAFKGEKELSVETIEYAINILNGGKKWTDLIGCRSLSFPSTISLQDMSTIFVLWSTPVFMKGDVAKRVISDTILWGSVSLPAKIGKSYIKTKRSYLSKGDEVNIAHEVEKPLERGIIYVRNR
jgi:hypothetical protein